MPVVNETLQIFLRRADRVVLYAKRFRGRASAIHSEDLEVVSLSTDDPRSAALQDQLSKSIDAGPTMTLSKTLSTAIVNSPQHRDEIEIFREKIRELLALETNLQLQLLNIRNELSSNSWSVVAAKAKWNRKTTDQAIGFSKLEADILDQKAEKVLGDWIRDVMELNSIYAIRNYISTLRANTVLGAYTVANRLDEDFDER